MVEELALVDEITQLLGPAVSSPQLKVLTPRWPVLYLCPHRPAEGQAENRHLVSLVFVE